MSTFSRGKVGKVGFRADQKDYVMENDFGAPLMSMPQATYFNAGSLHELKNK